MSGFTSTPYDWLRQVPKELKELDEIPLWGKSSEFPWEKFSKEIASALRFSSCRIISSDTNWRDPSEISSIVNENPFSLTFAINPLKGHAYLLFANSEIAKLLELLLHPDDGMPALEKDFILGFTQFLGLEAIDAFQKTGYEKSFIPQLLSQNELPEESCLCSDIAIHIDGQELHAMLCIPNQLRSSVKEYYSKKTGSLQPELYNKLEITLQLVAGVTTISTKEWQNSRPGDFIILDSCSLEPGEDKGRVMLTLNDLPIFRGKIKEGSIKILEYPLFHEVQTAMSPKDFDDEESEYDEESTDASESDFDESEEEYTDEHDDEEDDDEYSDDDNFTEDEDDEEEESEFEEEEELPKKDLKAPAASPAAVKSPLSKETAAAPAAAAASSAPKAAHAAPRQSPVKAEEIPITISVEVGRLQMTVQKLTELEPGNLLELDVYPENGVDLVVNGKCIGKGELLRIGDVLGVRILDKV